MISRKQWLALFISYLVYLLIGATVFLKLEADNEINNEKTLWDLQKKLSRTVLVIRDDDTRAGLQKALNELGSHLGEDLLADGAVRNVRPNGQRLTWDASDEDVSDEIGGMNDITSPHSNISMVEDWPRTQMVDAVMRAAMNENVFVEFPEDPYVDNLMWNLWNSFFFSFTAITTIGFGHMYPKTDAGQFFCIMYSLIGVPLNGIVFAALADLFGSKFMRKIDSGRYKNKSRIFLDSCLYLVPGLVVLMVFPAVIIMYFEDWSFLGAFYFAFITLTTIGFGDYVAGYPDWMSGPWVWVYRICIMIWICFGLGYLLMVIAFIQRALRSEEFRKLDRGVKKVFQKRMGATSSHFRTDLERIRRILITISKHRTKSEDITAAQDTTDGQTIPDDKIKQERSQSKDVSNVEILMELAETVMAAQSSSKPESEAEGTIRGSYENLQKSQSWTDNPAFEEDLEKGPSSVKRKFSKSLKLLRRESTARLPPPEEEKEEDMNTLGDVLNKVENMLTLPGHSAAVIVGTAEMRRASSFHLPVLRRNSSEDIYQSETEEGHYGFRDRKRRNTLATLLAT